MAWISDIFSSFTPLQQILATGLGVIALGFCTSLWLILPVYLLSLFVSVFVMKNIQRRTTCFDSEMLIPLIDFVEEKYKSIKRYIKQSFVSLPNTQDPSKLVGGPLGGHGTIYEEEQILLQYVVRDFIKSWYQIISVHNQTPDELETILSDITSKIFQKLSKVERNTLIGKVIYLYQGHLSSFQNALYTFEHQPKYRKKKVQDGREIRKIKDVESAFELKTEFHVAVKDPQNESDYLDAVTMILMKILVPDKAYGCSGGRELLVGILSQNVLLNIVDMISDTHWLHVTAIKLLSDDELLLEHPKTSLQDPQTSEREFQDVVSEGIPTRSESLNVTSQSIPLECISAQTTACDSKNTPSAQLYHSSAISSDSQSQIIQSGHNPQTSGSGGEDAYVTDDLSKYFRITPTIVEEAAAQPVYTRETISKPTLQCHGNIPSSQMPPGGNIIPSSSGLQTKQTMKKGLDSSNENIPDGNLNVDRPRFRPSFFLGNEDTISVDSSVSSQGSHFFDPVDSEDDKLSNDRFGPEGNSFREVSPASLQHACDIPTQNGTSNRTTPRESAVQSCSAENAETIGKSDQNDSPHPSKPELQELSKSMQESGISIAEDAFKELEGDTHTPPRFLIADISIPETETAREAGSAGSYTLYVVEYFAWHEEQGTSWVCKKDRVRRRYREFVTLQERLEEHPKYKGKIKDIKGPHKWSFSINGHLDKKSIGKRQKFLEAYLSRLVCKEDISHSMAMREFLAYEADPGIAFVKKAPERLEQVLVKTMSGVLNKISNVLPSLPDESKARAQGALESHKSEEILNSKEWKDEHDLDIEYTVKEVDNERRGSLQSEDIDGKYSFLDRSVESVMKSFINSVENPAEEATHSACNDGDTKDENKDNINEEFKDAEDKPLLSLPRRAGDGCEGESSHIPWEKEIPLITALLDLAVQSADGKELWVTEVEVLKFLKIIFGRALESLLKKEISELTTEERCAYYLYQLRDTLWPNGELLSASETEPSDEQRVITKQQAKECIMKFLPGIVPIAVGAADFEECVDNILKSIEHPKLNRHFAFCLLDLILETVIPEINLQELQNELLTKEASRN